MANEIRNRANSILPADIRDEMAELGALVDTQLDTHQAAALAAAKAAIPVVITLPRFTGWTKDGADHAITTIPALELPFAVTINRAYVSVLTAPGGGKTLALKLNDAALASVVETAVTGEAEALAIAIAANTDFIIKANETAAGAGANCDIILVGVMS